MNPLASYAALSGTPIVVSPILADGDVMLGYDPGPRGRADLVVFVGTRPLTDVEYARLEARWLVQDGMRDVLAWLGEPSPPPGPPLRHDRGRQLLDNLVAQTNAAA